LEVTIMGNREALIARCIPFFKEIKDRTPGPELEQWLNNTYGPDTELYADLARLIKTGIKEGWAANLELRGPRYRRSRICEPSAETHYFSITAVYMDSMDGTKDLEAVFRGDEHVHPYGEINLVVPLDTTAQLFGPNNGWCGAGWTSPAPSSQHFPEAKGGALIALFFLPAGRISYDLKTPRK
jgi:hypothetical protein